MKAFKAALVLVACLVMVGCAAKEDNIDEVSDDRNQPENTVVEDNSSEQTDEEEDGQRPVAANYSDSVAWSDDTILDIDNGQQIIYRAENGDMIYSTAASVDTVYAIIGSSDYPETEYRLIAIDRSADTAESKVIDELENEMNVQLGYYNDTLYLTHSAYSGQWIREVDAYEIQGDGSFRRTKDDLCEVIEDFMVQGYDFCADFDDFMTCLNEQNILFLRNRDAFIAAAFDVEGSLIREYAVEPDGSYIRTTDGKLMIESSGGVHRIYNLEGDRVEQIGEFGDSYDKTILEIKDSYVYYYTSEPYAYAHSNYYFYRYDPTSGTEDLLFETRSVPGQPYVMNGVEGFTVWNDKCCFINYEEGSLWWFVCDLSDDDYDLSRLGIVDEYRGIFDVASVGYEAKSYDCKKCGKVMFEYYIETFTLSESVIPYADKMNEYLQEKIQNYIEAEERYAQTELDYGTDETDSDELCHFYETRDMRFDGVTQYTFSLSGVDIDITCLEVDISGYEYYGGAHGYPIRERDIFNLQDGSLVTIGDICGISEDEFRSLAAEYTVKDYLESDGEYFFTDEESLYQTVYDYAGFGCLMHLNSKGVVIEYSPYFLGPYASGYIEVTIPYEDLGLHLTDIYGVNARRINYSVQL